MNILLILILLFGVILVILGALYFREQNLYAQRYAQYVSPSDDEKKDAPSILSSFVLPLLSEIGTMDLFKSFYTPSFKKQIRETGWLNKKAPELFIGAMVLIDVFLLTFIILGISLSDDFAQFFIGSPLRIILSILFFIYFCDAVPKITLDQKKKAFVKAMIRQLPDFFELYLINVTVGKSNIQALKDSVEVIEEVYPLVARHISVLIAELQTLPNNDLVWQNFSARIDNIEIKDAIKVIHHSDVLGLPVKHDLRVQLEHIRQAYLTKQEEKIARLPTTMLIPMILFIFPSLFIVVLAPAILNAMATATTKGLLLY